MRSIALFLAALALAASAAASAQDLATTCHASSSYDLTITPDALLFERAAPTPRRIRLQMGKLLVDGAPVHLDSESRDRLALFDGEVRALVPKVKAVADAGVDLATRAVRAEAASLDLGADTRMELDTELAARAADLKRRIANSTSTRDWQGDAFDRYAADIVADIGPIVAADLGQQAVAAALGGDLDAAASLRDRAARLARDLRPRLERRMQALRPGIETLCPSIRRLYELQRGVRDANRRPLDLLELARTATSAAAE